MLLIEKKYSDYWSY